MIRKRRCQIKNHREDWRISQSKVLLKIAGKKQEINLYYIYIYIFVISRLLFEIGRCFSAIANEADSTFEFYFKWDSISIVFRSDV
jgi:hypothetical protein